MPPSDASSTMSRCSAVKAELLSKCTRNSNMMRCGAAGAPAFSSTTAVLTALIEPIAAPPIALRKRMAGAAAGSPSSSGEKPSYKT